HFARALAKELKLPFLRLKTENIVSKWYGETERSMARALEMAEEIAPCVLFIDEIDRFGQRGQLGEHEASRRTFSILLEWLGDERRKTIVIGTTNRPQDLDEAFIRVGRFDYLIPILLPDTEARRQILEVHTKVIRKVPLAKDVNFDELAEMTENFTGAELEELVMRASRNALREDRDRVTTEDFRTALASFRINSDARMRQTEEYIRLAYEFCNDAKFLEEIARESGVSDRLEVLKRELQL
ncbi:MAG: AAA family ATPase, partial [Candidatus Methanospirareceae archaeon]